MILEESSRNEFRDKNNSNGEGLATAEKILTPIGECEGQRVLRPEGVAGVLGPERRLYGGGRKQACGNYFRAQK